MANSTPKGRARAEEIAWESICADLLCDEASCLYRRKYLANEITKAISQAVNEFADEAIAEANIQIEASRLLKERTGSAELIRNAIIKLKAAYAKGE